MSHESQRTTREGNRSARGSSGRRCGLGVASGAAVPYFLTRLIRPLFLAVFAAVFACFGGVAVDFTCAGIAGFPFFAGSAALNGLEAARARCISAETIFRVTAWPILLETAIAQSL
jgi:hypothetical protein